MPPAHLPALKAPTNASPGQRPGWREQTNVARPVGAQGSSAPTGRMAGRGTIPGALPRAGILRAVGAEYDQAFARYSRWGNFQTSVYEITFSCIELTWEAL